MESTSARLDVALNCRESISHEIASNWKVLCENNFECYHCPANHPTLAAIQDVDEDFSYEFCDRYFRTDRVQTPSTAFRTETRFSTSSGQISSSPA